MPDQQARTKREDRLVANSWGLDHPQVSLTQVIAGADQIAQRFRTLAASTGPSAQAYQFYTRIRAKAQDSIRGKILRKQRDSERPRLDYSFRDITDYVGVRVVTLYDHELVDALNYIIELVRAARNLTQPLIEGDEIWGRFKSALFIPRTDDPNDERDSYRVCARRLTDLIQRGTKGRIAKQKISNIEVEIPRDNRYSSAHLIFEATSYHQDFSLRIPVEFQIRTAGEDIWSEISHRLVYKSKSQYIWSRNQEAAYTAAETASRSLKRSTDALTEDIQAFYTQSVATADVVERFWREDGTQGPNQPPSLGLQFSLLIGLFFRINDFADGDDEFCGIFESYRAEIDSYKAVTEHPASAAHLQECINIIGKAQRLLPQTRSSSRPADKILVAQRRLLCDLEILRLRTLMILFHYHEACDGSLNMFSNDATGDEQFRGRCVDLYSEFCGYLDRTDLHVRPVCMIHYWKYLLSLEFDSTLTRRNILLALEALDADNTLPSWSIYRVLIPRAMASMLLEEANQLAELFAGPDALLIKLGGLRGELKTKLEDGLGYAIRSFKVHMTEHASRGDIRFGFEADDAIQDGELVLDITLRFFDNLGYFIARGRASFSKSIAEIVEHLSQRNLEETIQDSQKIDDFRGKLERVRGLVKASRGS